MNKKIKKYILSLIIIFKPINPCSIVGYIGQSWSKTFIEQGLGQLEYRGYDSAGYACLTPNQELLVVKASGKLKNLKDKLNNNPIDGHIAIGHTRWATHGPATEINAHPHTDCRNKIAVVHNGIIENYTSIKQRLLQQGHSFKSETDTEILGHLFGEFLQKYKNGQQQTVLLRQVSTEVANTLDGTFAALFVMQEYPDQLIAIRNKAPICIGIGEGENYVASDFLAFAGKTKKVVFLPDQSFAIISKDTIAIYDFTGKLIPHNIQSVDVSTAVYEKFEHEHFMLKEIYEQPKVIRKTVDYYSSLGNKIWDQLGISREQACNLKSVHMFGCGTSWHAARIAQFFFEIVAGIPASTHLASEFRYMPFFEQENTLYIAISQSGETADTLEAVRLVKSHNMPTVTLTNVPSSTMARETNGCLLIKAGPEIAVASTKAFTTQITAFYWLAHLLAAEKGIISYRALQKAEDDLKHAADILEKAIETYKFEIITKYAKIYAEAKRFMYLGRHVCYPFAMEGALKLKEISYIFAQGYPAGELKHGSIALVDLETPTVLFSHLDPLIYKKLVANAQEVKARHGHLIAFAFEGQDELINIADKAFILPHVTPLLEPLAMSGLMQFFSYEIAKTLGCDIDKPRNLAKAVTVE